MLRLGQKVILMGDKFEQGLPIGEHGFIIAYDRNPDNAFDYVVRVPTMNKHVFVPKDDVELEETLLQREAERVEKESLIDFALATRNEALFKRLLNGEEEPAQEKPKETPNASDFVKQVNLRAWI
ncbi:ATPase [Paenibacillus antri]|uniref:ATPase n=1 Tax=Paenibacillus antri TaxID=2582848 RepID=A0A5R9FW93_9BACL|nr:MULTISPECIES: ATPase [Paenibacillus]TLS48257.1 ATPase [Paenibacillus antri]